MITTVNNIAKTNATFATSSKWSDSFASDFDAGRGNSCVILRV